MRQINGANVRFFLLLSTCLNLFSCDSDTDDFPKDYVGFEKATETVDFDKNEAERELEIKIIATEKSKEDRVVLLSIPPSPPGQMPTIKLAEDKVTIKAGKKSAKIIAKIYPKLTILKKQHVTLSCVPQWKEGKTSMLTIRLQRK